MIYNADMSMEYELVFRIVTGDLPAAGIKCLMIGGHAVNHYGFVRATQDIDFMIAASDEQEVRRIMKNAGFTGIASHENVVFFHRPESPLRVDFLKVDAETMDTLVASAVEIDYFDGQEVSVPCLQHLIAMKIFALKGGSQKREDRDFPDIVQLVLKHNLDLEDDLKPLCDRYGTVGLYDRLCTRIRALAND